MWFVIKIRTIDFKAERLFCYKQRIFNLWKLFKSTITLPDPPEEIKIEIFQRPSFIYYVICILAHLEAGDYNVIITSSEVLLAGPYYIEAVKNCRFIGRFSAYFIDYLVSKGFDLRLLHVIGFSLGAQISGFTGQYLKSGRLPRITGKMFWN